MVETVNLCKNKGCTNLAAVKGQCRPCYKYQYDTGRLKVIQENRNKTIIQTDGIPWPASKM